MAMRWGIQGIVVHRDRSHKAFEGVTYETLASGGAQPRIMMTCSWVIYLVQRILSISELFS